MTEFDRGIDREDGPPWAERLETLEVRAAFQEDTIATLNAAIIRQRGELDALREQLDTMHQRLRALTSHLAEVSDDDAPPPHY